eukprot:1673381-Prymnesium_polylepis.2
MGGAMVVQCVCEGRSALPAAAPPRLHSLPPPPPSPVRIIGTGCATYVEGEGVRGHSMPTCGVSSSVDSGERERRSCAPDRYSIMWMCEMSSMTPVHLTYMSMLSRLGARMMRAVTRSSTHSIRDPRCTYILYG